MTCGEQTTNFVKPFRFLNLWTKHATFMDVVRQNWNADFIGDPFLMFNHKLKKVKATLSKWSKDTFGGIFKQLAILEDVVKVKTMFFEEEPTVENRIVLQKAQAELKKYLSLEEKYWRQKARMAWFAEGDRNTSFFYNHVNGKRKKLQLKRIQNGDGNCLEDQEQMAIVAVDFYQRQFTKEGDLTDFSMPENFPSRFQWSRIWSYARGATLPKPITYTNLVILPKKLRVQTFSELQPISLSNFINNVLSRVLHDRLEKFLPSFISPNQSGFVKGRSIFENILLTQEIITDIRMRGSLQMLNAREEVEHEIMWEMKRGTTNIWNENWTGLGALYHYLPQNFPIDENLQEVAELRQGGA
nr:uncharacterized protein LOC104095914 [Nicotiana tomentosiformis]